MKYNVLTLILITLGSSSGVRASSTTRFTPYFESISQQLDLPPKLLESICIVESDLRTHVININDGGIGNSSFGICQISFNTAKFLGIRLNAECSGKVSGLSKCILLEPRFNIYLAGFYLRKQLNRYRGNLSKAVSAYNAGSSISGNLKYVRKVLYTQKALIGWSKSI